MSKSSEAVKRWRANTKARMIAAMGGKCQCCRYDKCHSALAFHHIDPSAKELGFGDTRANNKNWSSVVQELKKCILVCHNCHSEIHAGIRDLPEVYSTFDESYADYNKVLKGDNKCPHCGNEKSEYSKQCKKCSDKNRRKVDWESIDLLKLLESHTISDLEDILGISNAAIYKRRDKLLKSKI